LISKFSLAKGKNLISEDFCEVKEIEGLTIGVLCDGVGSAFGGADASKECVNYLINAFSNMPKSWDIEKSIKHFINSINSILYQKGIDEYGEPQFLTTLALVIIKGNRLYGANVGDSRIYLFRDKLYQLSIDHNYENTNGLTEAIGLKKDVNIYYFENNIELNDKILLCSDGLYSVLSEEEIAKDMHLSASLIVKEASKKVNDNLEDDTSAILIEIDKIDKTEELKKLDLKIPEKLSKNQNIDGFVLIKPLIQNERTWLAIKKGIKYVLKFPTIDAIDDEKKLDLFVKEAWYAKTLKAGFFPKAVIPKNRSYRYYVMEYIDGENLKDKKLSVDESVRLAKMLLRAGEFLVRKNLVHGDIKPENIIQTKTFKLIDFGSITEIFSTTSKAGTPTFLAPERFEGEPINESTEIFAIGVTLYKVLTNKYPYGEIEPFQTPTFKPPTPPKEINKNIPNWLNIIILKAIAIDKNKRYQNYSEMLYEISNPEKVSPYFADGYKIEGEINYRLYFIISFILNIVLGVLLIT